MRILQSRDFEGYLQEVLYELSSSQLLFKLLHKELKEAISKY
jgi:hypothetical protein